MGRRVRIVLLSVLAVVVVVIGGAFTTVQMRWDRTIEAPTPTIAASTDPAVIERGRYLVYGPANCAECHARPEDKAALKAGAQPPLAGGDVFELPFGKAYVPNITPDPETGIGTITDGEFGRMLRYSVKPDGRVGLPFMEYQNMSQEDMVAILSFLRSQPPVRHEVPSSEWNLLGRAILAFAIKPIGPEGTPPEQSPPSEPTIERGRYLANSVSTCLSCHTRRDQRTGAFLTPKFSGGETFDLDSTHIAVTPNLTPDPETGHIYKWTEDEFVARFRAGPLVPNTPMPWSGFGKMSDDDVRAIYRYLRSLPPVHNETGATVQPKEKKG